MMLSVGILAGGLATRLRPITETIPKSLIEVAGKPFICHQLEYLRKQRIKNVVICIGYLGNMIQEVVQDGSQWEMQVTYSPDGAKLLGTGGAIKQALPLLGEQFFILYGDSYLPIDFNKVQSAFLDSDKVALMTVIKNENKWDKSNVEFEGGQIIEYNKDITRSEMLYIDYGLGIMQAKVLDLYSKNEAFDLSQVYNDLSINGLLAGYEVHERFYEIGSTIGISDAEAFFLKITAG